MELNLQAIVAIIFLLTSLVSVFNHKFLKLPNTIAVMLVSTALSLIIFGLNSAGVIQVAGIERFVEKMHFESVLLHWFLPVLLFAGSLHVSFNDLREYKFQIITFATIGVIISAVIIAGLISLTVGWFGLQITFLQALVFGVLISSTDPVCVLGILSGGTVSRSLRSKITGESLFNDGTSVVLFLTLASLAFSSKGLTATVDDIEYHKVAVLFLVEVFGGIAIGLITAYIASILTRMVDAHDIEVMITLALAMGSYTIAEIFHVSAPIAVVVSGLYIGNSTAKKFMSTKSREHVNVFWLILDEIVNSILFVMMGLVLVMVDLSWKMMVFSFLTIGFMLIARYLSIIGSASFLLPLKRAKLIESVDFKKTPFIMTWSGLRGGISIALAISIPNTFPEVRDLILSMTITCVFFSVVVQGLSLPKFLEYITKDDKKI